MEPLQTNCESWEKAWSVAPGRCFLESSNIHSLCCLLSYLPIHKSFGFGSHFPSSPRLATHPVQAQEGCMYVCCGEENGGQWQVYARGTVKIILIHSFAFSGLGSTSLSSLSSPFKSWSVAAASIGRMWQADFNVRQKRVSGRSRPPALSEGWGKILFLAPLCSSVL